MKYLTPAFAAIWLLGAAITQNLKTQPQDSPALLLAAFKKAGLKAPTADPAALETAYLAAGTITFSSTEDILSFDTPEHVHLTTQYLEAAAEDFAYKYWQANGFNLPSGQTAVNFNKPYESFESGFPGFVSLRSIIESNFLTWLNSGATGTTPDPEKDQYPETGLRALLNQFSEIKVQGVYFRVSAQGSTMYRDYPALLASRVAAGSRRLQALTLPATKCNDPVFNSKVTFHTSGNTVLYTSLQHYCNPETPTYCTYKVRATTRIFYKDATGKFDAWPGPVYAQAFGFVSGLFHDPATSTIYRDLCFTTYPYNQSGVNFKFWIHSAVNTIVVNARTKLGWSFAKSVGEYGVDPDLIFVWPFNA